MYHLVNLIIKLMQQEQIFKQIKRDVKFTSLFYFISN